ncbi:MAG: hypothetical protein JEY97_15195, partial [Bacteroidales bacterium]|nr:hypothetical protein [Bacteroidales bacterium]
MKKQLYFLAVFLLVSTLIFSQKTTDECVFCKNNEVTYLKYSSAVGQQNTSTGHASFAGGINSVATGDYSFTFGENSIASGKSSISLGFETKAGYRRAIAIGYFAEADLNSSIAIGKYVKTLAPNAITFGSGYGSVMLENSIQSTMMIGFNSQYPTLFIGKSPLGDKTGSIGIGNITENLQAKLHIKADIEEDASIMLEPASTTNYAKIFFGDIDNRIEGRDGEGLIFNTQ